MGWIRLLLAVSVLIMHADYSRLFGLELVRGQAAVQSFYVISGFYMALVLLRKYPADLSGYRTFMSARVLRLAPAYVVVLGLSLLLPMLGAIDHPAYDRWRADGPRMETSAKLAYALPQATLVGQDLVWFTRLDREAGTVAFDATAPAPYPTSDPAAKVDGMHYLFVGQAWTLGVELQFYALAPLIVRRLGVIALAFLASVGVRLTLASLGFDHSPWTYRFFPSELAFFLLGSAAYHAYDWFERTGREATLRRAGRVALPVLIGMILFLFEFDIPLRALIIILATAVSLPAIFALTRRQKFDRWIGELSYPIYISHELVRLILLSLTGAAGIGSMLIGTLVASIALLVLVEQPFERLRSLFVAGRLTRRRASAKPAAPTSTPALDGMVPMPVKA